MKLDIIVIVVSALLLSSDASQCAVTKTKPNNTFCTRPPVDPLSLPSYMGTWYQLFVDENALRTSGPVCVTANYTLGPNGKVGVLNCQNVSGGKARCVTGAASRRPGGGAPGRLQVQFSPQMPPGAYNVAALLGDKEYGYYAAAVFSCKIINGKPKTAWFILGRTPFKPYRTLWELTHKLNCKGYDVYNERFIYTKQGEGCNYFFDDSRYTVVPSNAGPPMPSA